MGNRGTSDFSTVLLNATYLAVGVEQNFQAGGKGLAYRKVQTHSMVASFSAVLSLEGTASIMEYQLVSIQQSLGRLY